jgi:phosphoserine aminotransferase
MAQRVHNFNAGPAMLPEPVLEKAAAAVRELDGIGMSVLEISHRGKEYAEINREAQERFARIAGIEKTHKVLLLQGGASQQFAMVPMNLMPKGGTADYVVTGSWAKKAQKEAALHGTARIAATSESEGFSRIPRPAELKLDPRAAYLHYTSNNTIFGTQFPYEPDSGGVPLVADMSSDIFSRRRNFACHGLIYAGAQKNLGPAGVTLVAVRADLLQRSPKDLPAMLSYAVHAEKDSVYNTPPVFAVYVVKLVLEWIEQQGGLAAVERRNADKAKLLYEVLDGSGFYRGTAAGDSRSQMNVTFRLPSEDLEKKLLDEAKAARLAGLKGHRSVGGCRASLYNAMPTAGVQALVGFLKEFERRNG